MSLKLVVDTLDGLDDAVAKLYTKNADGKFALGVDGLDDHAELKKAMNAERDATRAAEKRAAEAEKKAKKFDGLGMSDTEIEALVTRFKSDEEGQLLAKGKIDEVFGKRTEKMRGDFENQLKAKDAEVEKERARTIKYTGKVLENSIRQAASTAGVHANAVEDALLRARGVFTLDDDGNPVAMRDGTVLNGKDGRTPLTPLEWLESMREKAPHWYPAPASGGGARQSNGSGPHKTIKRAEFDMLAPANKRETLKSGVKVID
jgi:hypothetical protein